MQKNIIKNSTIMSQLRHTLSETNAVVIVLFTVLMSVNSLSISQEVHEAHTHGTAHLTLAYEDGVLEAQFESPAMSLLGFEHKPKNQNQIEIIEETKALLSSPENVLTFNTSHCSTSTVSVNIIGPAGQALDQDHHDHKEEKKEGHDHHHDHGHSAEEHEEHNEPIESHSEVNALYVFNCDNERLQSVTTDLFEHFSKLEKIKVDWVTETQQGQNILQASSTTVRMK